MEAKFTHLPGYQDDFSWMRVLRRTVTFLTPKLYKLDLMLSAKVEPSTPHFLIAYAANGFADQQTDDSTNPWTLAWWSGDFCDPQTVFSGAGPPSNQGMGMYYRAIVPGESATVATMQLQSNSVRG